VEQILGRSVPRRSVLAGSSAAALGVTSLALPSGQAAASFAAILAVASETGGVVYGWGDYPENSYPVFGTARTSDAPTPLDVTGGASFTWPEVVQVTTGKESSFGLTADGRVYAWGAGYGGLMGDGATVNNQTPGLTSLAGDVRIVQVSAHDHVFALQDSGRIWAWGAGDATNSAGVRSGLAATTATPADVTSTLGLAGSIGGSDRVVRVLAALKASAVLTATGRVLTWGTQDGFGPVLGQGTTGDAVQSTATQIAGSLAGTDGTPAQVVQIALGPTSGAALGRDGTVHTWGRGTSGELGTGSTSSSDVPVDIMGVEGSALAATVGDPARRIVQVAVGGNQMLARGLDGRVYAWGNATSGSLGNGSTSPNVSTPIEITGSGALPAIGATSSRIVQILATQTNGYALGADGRVYSWGDGSDSKLGNNSLTTQTSPVEITGFGVFAQLAPNTGEGATRAPRRIVLLGGGPVNNGQHVLAIDDRGVA
jgi:alpha-tubulin suppressor-like RCC1 family protein